MFAIFILWFTVTPQTNGYTQVTPTGTYTTPIILADTTGSDGSIGMYAQLSIALEKRGVAIGFLQ